MPVSRLTGPPITAEIPSIKRTESNPVKPAEKSRMLELFARSGLAVDEGQAALFARFYELLARHNDKLDLSRLKRFEDIVVKHFVDCALLASLADIPSPVVDIGSGGGFPGIPLKIMKPDLSVVLAEPRHKRVEFLRMVIESLGLKDVSVYPHLVGPHSFFDANAVVTRALEPARDTIERARHFLPLGGRIILMKGPSADDEPGADSIDGMHDFRKLVQRDYSIPGTPHRRRLLVFEKTSPVRAVTYRVLTRAEGMVGTAITSADNAAFKAMKKTASGASVKKTERTIVGGRKLVLEAAARLSDLCESLVLFDGLREDDDAVNALVASFAERGRLYVLKKSLYNELDVSGTGGPLLVVRVPELAEWDGSAAEGCTLLVPFQDPANAGAVIRTAAAFGVERVVVLREAANPFHPRCVRASGGAVFGVTLLRGPSIGELSRFREQKGFELVALDRAGEPIAGFRFPKGFALLAGVEGPGLPDALRAKAVSIPMEGGVESLNAAVAASIALYAWRSSEQASG